MRSLIFGLLWVTLPAFAHPDKVGQALLTHFATGAHPMTNAWWSDLATSKATWKFAASHHPCHSHLQAS